MARAYSSPTGYSTASAISSDTSGKFIRAFFQSAPAGSTSLTEWTSLTFMSMMAIMFLPRQFHVAVVENSSKKHILKAMWLFPLYLFIINIFVLPVAFGGSFGRDAG